MAIAPQPGLKTTFANARGDAVHVGPFSRLIFDGQELKDGDRKLVARHVEHRWQLPDGSRYSRLECYVPCEVLFQARDRRDAGGRQAGPFSTLSSVDGVLYGDHRILAFCDNQLNDWYSFDFGQHYACMVVVPHRPG